MDRFISFSKVVGSIQPTVALFTTYSISLTAFEIYLLPHLLQSDCKDIIVLCDSERYMDTEYEAKSRHVGLDYRLIGVHRPGAFHAKTAFLANDREAVLLVGSGNLTYAGMFRNLEVFECFPKENRENRFNGVFCAYREMIVGIFDELQSQRDNRGFRDSYSRIISVLDECCGGEVDDEEPILLHSLYNPVVDQVHSLINGDNIDTLERMTILSPFFSSTPKFASEIYEMFNLKEMWVIVPDERSSFPFEKMPSNMVVCPCRSDVCSKNKNIHAKVYAFQGVNKGYLVTGSANFTNSALQSSDNFEAVVFRKLPLDDMKLFIEAERMEELPEFEEQIWQYEKRPKTLIINSAMIVGVELEINIKLPTRLISKIIMESLKIKTYGHTFSSDLISIDSSDLVNGKLSLKIRLPEGFFNERISIPIKLVAFLGSEEYEGFSWVDDQIKLSQSVGLRRISRVFEINAIDNISEEGDKYSEVLLFFVTNLEKILNSLTAGLEKIGITQKIHAIKDSELESRRVSIESLEELSKRSLYEDDFWFRSGTGPFVFNLLIDFERLFLYDQEKGKKREGVHEVEIEADGGLGQTKEEIIDKRKLLEIERDVIDPFLSYLKVVQIESYEKLYALCSICNVFMLGGLKFYSLSDCPEEVILTYTEKWLRAVVFSEHLEKSNLIKAFKEFPKTDIVPTPLSDFRNVVVGVTCLLFYCKIYNIDKSTETSSISSVGFSIDKLLDIWEDIMINLYTKRSLNRIREDVQSFFHNYLRNSFLERIQDKPPFRQEDMNEILDLWVNEIEAMEPRRSELRNIFSPYFDLQEKVKKSPNEEIDTTKLPRIPAKFFHFRYFNISKKRLVRIIRHERVGLSKVPIFQDACPRCNYILAIVECQRLKSYKPVVCDGCNQVMIPWEG